MEGGLKEIIVQMKNGALGHQIVQVLRIKLILCALKVMQKKFV